jgi:hypothetical protein
VRIFKVHKINESKANGKAMSELIEAAWWQDEPVLEVKLNGSIENRDQAFRLTQVIVNAIEGSSYQKVIVILDLSALGKSPSAAALLAGNIPETFKIEHLVMVNAPMLIKMAVMPFVHLRGKLHFESNQRAAEQKAESLRKRI